MVPRIGLFLVLAAYSLFPLDECLRNPFDSGRCLREGNLNLSSKFSSFCYVLRTVKMPKSTLFKDESLMRGRNQYQFF